MSSNEDIWKVCETILLEEEEILLPLSKLLYLIKIERESWDLDLESLKTALKERSLFMIYDFPEEAELWDDEEDEAMAEKGFFKGDKVMLLDRKPSPEDMQEMILGNLDHLYRSLSDMATSGQIDGLEVDNYVQSMARAKELYTKFSDLIIDEENNE